MLAIEYRFSGADIRIFFSRSFTGAVNQLGYEHSAFMMGSDMYLWGGAAYDKSYLSDLKKLSNADGMTARETNYFMKKVVVSSTVESSDAVTVEVIVNTKVLGDTRKRDVSKHSIFEHP